MRGPRRRTPLTRGGCCGRDIAAVPSTVSSHVRGGRVRRVARLSDALSTRAVFEPEGAASAWHSLPNARDRVSALLTTRGWCCGRNIAAVPSTVSSHVRGGSVRPAVAPLSDSQHKCHRLRGRCESAWHSLPIARDPVPALLTMCGGCCGRNISPEPFMARRGVTVGFGVFLSLQRAE